jgi:RecB family exonuclease
MPFPGIFSSIDAYTKHSVEGWLEKTGDLPWWLQEIGKARAARKVPPKEFRTEVDGVLLTGIPDSVLEMADGTFFILDYKTARYTERQDALASMYRVQLNGYALIAEDRGMSPVTGLALVYFEPPATEVMRAEAVSKTTAEGFTMPFTPQVIRIGKHLEEIRVLAKKAKEIHDLPTPPEGRAGCENCRNVQGLFALLGNGSSPSV